MNKEGVASILLAVLDGFALQAMSDPDFDTTTAYGTFAELLEIYVAVKSK